MTDEDFQARQIALVHAVQSGVAYDHGSGGRDGSPKHLRVGVNMAMVEHSALAQLLIGKGVITKEEYQAALIVGLEAEVERYERMLTDRHGVAVKLA